MKRVSLAYMCIRSRGKATSLGVSVGACACVKILNSSLAVH